jgi:hypothetical protein
MFFPNSPISSFEEDPAQGDTEVIYGHSGTSFRNARRTVMPRRWRLTLWTPDYSDGTMADAIAIKEAAQGRLMGFKFINPRDGVTYDVAFVNENWTVQLQPSANPETQQWVAQAQIELEEVVDGIPA